MLAAMNIAQEEISALEDGTLDQKAGALGDVFDPVTKKLMKLDGNGFVDTMSEEAVEFYSEATAYWAQQGNFTAYESKNWGTKRPPKSDPKNAIKCSAQKGKCQCHVDSVVYYGLKGSDGRLDTSVNYAVSEADHSGYTFCKNEVFGDPLPGNKKKEILLLRRECLHVRCCHRGMRL